MKLIQTLVEITRSGIMSRINPNGERYEEFTKVLKLWNKMGGIDLKILDYIGDEDYHHVYVDEYWRIHGKKKLEELNKDIEGTIVELENKEAIYEYFIRLRVDGFKEVAPREDGIQTNDVYLSFEILEGSYLKIPGMYGDEKLDLIKVIGMGDRKFNKEHERFMKNHNAWSIMLTRLRLTIFNQYIVPFDLYTLTGADTMMELDPQDYVLKSEKNN
jgi:hypothetical protein